MYKEKIEAYFAEHKDEMIKDICDLVRIKSDREEPKEGMPYGEGPAKALAWALNRAGELGFAVKNYDNYVGAVDFGDLPANLDILAHLDIVPLGDNWTVTQPLEPVEVDGKLYGRGTADDKGPAIAALYAMKAVKDLGIPLTKNVRLILGTDEECGSSDIHYYYTKEKEAPMTFSPDAAFPVTNVEKGRLSASFTAHWAVEEVSPRILSIDCGTKINVVPAEAEAVVTGFSKEQVEKYALQATQRTGVVFGVTEEGEDMVGIHAEGAAGHASTPMNGNNALTALLDLLTNMPFAPCVGFRRLQSVAKLFPHGDWAGKAAGIAMGDDVSGDLTISLDMFHYNNTELTGEFDCRAPICANNGNVRDVLKEKMIDDGIYLEKKDMAPPHHVPGDSPFIHTLLKCYEEYSGLPGKCEYTGGGTYVHDLGNGVAFGCSLPGTDNRMHGADEFAVIDELLLGAKIFTQVIIDLCS